MVVVWILSIFNVNSLNDCWALQSIWFGLSSMMTEWVWWIRWAVPILRMAHIASFSLNFATRYEQFPHWKCISPLRSVNLPSPRFCSYIQTWSRTIWMGSMCFQLLLLNFADILNKNWSQNVICIHIDLRRSKNLIEFCKIIIRQKF